MGACDIDISIYLSEYDSYVCMTTGRVIELHVDCQIARCEDGRGLLRHLAPPQVVPPFLSYHHYYY